MLSCMVKPGFLQIPQTDLAGKSMRSVVTICFLRRTRHSEDDKGVPWRTINTFRLFLPVFV
jgi:hypothetical protein